MIFHDTAHLQRKLRAHSGSSFLDNRPNSRPLSTAVVGGWGALAPVALPLGAKCTSLREGVAELVTDDVARLVAWMLVMSSVLLLAEARYKHSNRAKTAAVCLLYTVLRKI